MATKKRLPKKTYKEFMAWLEGVECMQPDDWTPTSDQWRTIRSMLDNMLPDKEKVVEVATVNVPTSVATPSAVPTRFEVPAFSSLESAAAPAPAPARPVRLVPSALQEQPPVAPGVPASTSTRKDQILDTSDGNYTSEFM